MDKRNMPYSLEAEQSVLGAAFISKYALQKICDDVINNEDKINEIKNNLKEFKIENSATLIYNNIKEIVDGSK